jgi:ADP-heptose:LPS heptosyltransferase
MILAWTGAPIRVAHRRGFADLYATDLIDPPENEAAEREVETKVRLLGPLGVELPEPTEIETTLGDTREAIHRMKDWLDGSVPAGKRIVGLYPGARKPEHRVPARIMGEIGRDARLNGGAVVVLWGPGEEDLAGHVASLCDGIEAPPTDLEELAALMRCCAVVVTNDTGPMHLAGAVGTPTVTLWGPSDPAEVCPVGARDVRISGAALPCKPCLKNECPRQGVGTSLPDAHEECMQLIGVDEVVQSAVKILGGGSS